MAAPLERALGDRIRELRRRHFGPRGKVEFARRLGVAADEYERFERGTIPPGDVLVRMCEATGEDLQWLLTGVASRGTVVISQARTRHQELLTNLARLLDEKPALAAPVEAFVDLLARGEQAVQAAGERQLPYTSPRDFIPIFDSDELPEQLPAEMDGEWGPAFAALLPAPAATVTRRVSVDLVEPASGYESSSPRRVDVVRFGDDGGNGRDCVHNGLLARCFPAMFGVRVRDDSMTPMLRGGDAVLVSVGVGPKVGQPALCRLAAKGGARCRIWLGQDERYVKLGRLADGGQEDVARADVRWSLEVLYRLAAA